MGDEIESESIEKISCTTIKDAILSKIDEIAYLQELKTIYDAPEIKQELDKLVDTCKEQLEHIKKIDALSCPLDENR